MEKRIISIILMLALTFALAACGTDGSNTKAVSTDADENSQTMPYEQEFVKKGIVITEKMIEKANSEDLLDYLTGGDAEIWAYSSRYKNLDGFKPDRAIVFSFTAQALNELCDTIFETSPSTSSSARVFFRDNVLSEIANWRNIQYGERAMVAMAILRQIEAFQKPADNETPKNALAVLLYDVSVYDDEYDEGENMKAICLVSFCASEENTVLAEASFISGDIEDLISVFYSDAEYILPQLGDVENDFTFPQIPQTGVEIKVFDDSELKAIIDDN
ncbi:MAG: hypothetical protein LBK23_02435 [Oscillospiraceae bacterium]|jgi:predicted small lipoprotein YifL|nr:hypothetical protein [Oscillospiraceae bacterium]